MIIAIVVLVLLTLLVATDMGRDDGPPSADNEP